MKNLVTRIDKSLLHIENTLIVMIVSIMVIMAFMQVLLRNLFSTGILWGDIFLRHLVLWVGFIGASLATRQQKHISIDVLNRITSRKILPYIQIVVDFVTLIVCFVLANAGYRFLAFEIDFGTILFNDVPAWIFQLIIPLGFDLIALRFLLRIIDKLLAVFQRPHRAEGDFNWGAFSLTGLWLLFHKRYFAGLIVWIGYAALIFLATVLSPTLIFLICLALLLLLMYFGVQGNRIARESMPPDSGETLQEKERIWNIAGLIVAVLIVAGLIYLRFFQVISTAI